MTFKTIQQLHGQCILHTLSNNYFQKPVHF